MKNWKAFLGATGIFLLGALAGGLVTHRVYQRHIRAFLRGEPQPVTNLIVRRLSWRLRLDETQRAQLRTIIRDTQSEMAGVRREMRPKIKDILERAEQRVRDTLRPDQQEKFDKLIAERQAKWSH